MPAQKEHQIEHLFAKLGRRLRAAREERGTPLQEVSDRTRIQMRFLQQIEAGSLEGLPDFVFVRGFIRSYAQVLGLNDSILKDDLQRIIELNQKNISHQKKTQQAFSEDRLYDIDPQQPIWPILLMLGFIAIVLAWAIYVFLVP